MEPVRIGVIGCGLMGSRHAAVVAERDETDLIAIADVREKIAKAVGEKHSAKHVYSSAEALIDNQDVEAVTIAMPVNARTPIALDALAAGKHVLLEKPVAMNADEVARMIAARGDLVGGVFSCRFRCHESAKVATEVVARGELGELRVVHFRGMLTDRGPKPHPIPAWRVSRKLNGGGFWVNWGCYDLDFLMGITGWTLKPSRVLAQTWPIADHLSDRVAKGSDAEAHALALVTCEGGTVLSMERGESLPLVAESTWHVIGSKASLRLDMLKLKGNQVLLDRGHPDGPVTTEVVWEGDNKHEATTREPILDFARAIRTNTEPMTSFERAMVMQKITDAIYESAEKGRAVEIG